MSDATTAATPIGVNQHDDLLHTLLLRAYGRRKHAAKALARDSGASVRTTQKWLTKERTPSGPYFLAALRECQELRDALNKVLDRKNAELSN